MQACLDMLAWHMLPEALAFVEAQQARFPLDYRFAALRALIHREQGESASAITALLSMGSFQRVLPGHLQTRQWQVMYSRQSAREVDLQHVQTALAQAMTYQEMLARRLREADTTYERVLTHLLSESHAWAMAQLVDIADGFSETERTSLTAKASTAGFALANVIDLGRLSS